MKTLKANRCCKIITSSLIATLLLVASLISSLLIYESLWFNHYKYRHGGGSDNGLVYNSIDHHRPLSEYNIHMYRTVAYYDKNKHEWVVPIQGHVYEQYLHSFDIRWTSKHFMYQIMHWLLVVQASPNENLKQHIIEDWLRYSVGPYLNLTISFQMKDGLDNDKTTTKDFVVHTDEKGYLDTSVSFSCSEMSRMAHRVTELGSDGWYEYYILNNTARGHVQLTATGRPDDTDVEYLSVISDIDDTVKHTNVIDFKEMIHNTFFREFEIVPFMDQVFTSWERDYAKRMMTHKRQSDQLPDPSIAGNLHECDQAQQELADRLLFHYVSSSPIQLHARLETFLRDHNMPFHSIDLRKLSIIDSTFFNILKPSLKPAQLERIIEAHPHRKFILVGDSHERDPLIYGNLMRKYPNKIKHIFIRCPCPKYTSGADQLGSDTENNFFRCCSRHDKKFLTSFQGLPEERWHIFSNPNEMMNIDIFAPLDRHRIKL